MISEELCKLWDADHSSQGGHTPKALQTVGCRPFQSGWTHSKGFANCGMQTIPVRVDTLQRQKIASTGREGPQYNQILTPPLASGRVHSQTLATVH